MPRRLQSRSSPSSEKNQPSLFFYGHSPKQPYHFLSQHYTHPFAAPAPFPNVNEEPKTITFTSTEQYMMYAKALLFHDTATAEEILATANPGKQKALGRGVADFDDAIWEQHREKIVEEGNWWKFHGGDGTCTECAKIRKALLATGGRELVEASPRDRIWGVGFGMEKAEANRLLWGLNLLGKALMRVRDRLRAEEQGEEGKGTECETVEREMESETG